MKLIYIQDDFLDPKLCQPFLELYDKKDSFLESVTHSDPHESLTVNPNIPKFDFDKNHGAKYWGGNVDPIHLTESKDELFSSVINDVTNLCKFFDDNIKLQYVGVVRWPIGTFMKPHYDSSAKEGIYDLFAALLYLNDDFDGGYTGFKDFEVKPKTGKLLIFSNSQYKHHVTRVIGRDRYALSFWYNSSTDTHQSV